MHVIEHLDFPSKLDKKKIEDECNRISEQNSDYGGSLYRNIQWCSRKCLSRSDAEEFLDQLDNHDYWCGAVLYLDESKIKKSKKLLDLEKRMDELLKEYNEKNGFVHYGNVRSSFVTCRNCRSKIAQSYIKRNYCSVCNSDMRPPSALETLKRLKERHDSLKKEYQKELNKQKAKYEDQKYYKWLVKIEYHC